MSEDQRLCDSRDWWPTMKLIAKRFEETFNSRGNKDLIFFQLNAEKFEAALEMYERSWWMFKEHVYGEAAEIERIDRHKIIALYILSFLIKKPFDIIKHPENKNTDLYLLLINERFSLVVMVALLSAWNGNKEPSLADNEKKWLVILFNHFKLKLKKANQSFISDDPSNVTDILSLSQIAYCVEKSCV